MFTFGVMASGGGSNFRALLDHVADGSLDASCEFLITNSNHSGAALLAREKGIPVCYISSVTHPNPHDYERALLAVLQKYPVKVVALAGYMKHLPDSFIQALPDRILNVHPSLLPKFGGAGYYGIRVHRAVLDAHETTSGPTIHLVNEHYDQGRILAQADVPVLETDSPESLAARVLKQEHDLYWRTLRDYAETLPALP